MMAPLQCLCFPKTALRCSFWPMEPFSRVVVRSLPIEHLFNVPPLEKFPFSQEDTPIKNPSPAPGRGWSKGFNFVPPSWQFRGDRPPTSEFPQGNMVPLFSLTRLTSPLFDGACRPPFLTLSNGRLSSFAPRTPDGMRFCLRFRCR